MANPVTLLSLRTEVREQTDAVGDGHITDAALNGWINRGIRVYWGKLADADPDRLTVTSTTAIVTSAGTLEYALPAAFFQIRGLDLEEAGQVYTLRSFPWEERNRRRALNGTASGLDLPRYRVARNGEDGSDARLVFDIDPGARTFTLHYIPVPTALAADGDEIDDVLGFTDYVIAFAASRVRNKRDEPDAVERAEMARVEADIARQAKKRHVDGHERPPRVRRRRHSNNPLRW